MAITQMGDLYVGQQVLVSDPLGYSGAGVVTAFQDRPHPAVQVRMQTITDRTDQSVRGREIWVLAPHVTPHEDDDLRLGEHVDTPQQKRALRLNRIARKVREKYGTPGTRVVGIDGPGMEGTVAYHVPAATSQGGVLIVDWDNGFRGRVQPGSIRLVEENR